MKNIWLLWEICWGWGTSGGCPAEDAPLGTSCSLSCQLATGEFSFPFCFSIFTFSLSPKATFGVKTVQQLQIP